MSAVTDTRVVSGRGGAHRRGGTDGGHNPEASYLQIERVDSRRNRWDVDRNEAQSRRDRHARTVQQLRERYKLDVRPLTCQFRVTKKMEESHGRLAGYRISADILKHRRENPYLAFEVKPPGGAWVKEIKLVPSKAIAQIVSPALEIGCARLTLTLGYNWARSSWGCSWRLKTKWTKNSKVHRKIPVFEDGRCKMCTHWNVKQEFPQMGGEITSNESNVKHDLGRLQVKLNRVKFATMI